MARAPSKEEVSDVLRSIERYNPGNLTLFCSYIKQTCEDKSYDIEAYLAVLKLFQFNPNMFDLETTRVILLKAMTSLPRNDFSLCLYLLAEEHHQHQEIATLVELNNSLESCLFEDVWEFLNLHPEVLKGKVRNYDADNDGMDEVTIVGFEQRVREFIAHVISSTYQVVEAKVIASMLGGLNDALLAKFCEAHGWKMVEGGKIFVAHQEEIVKSKNIVESIRFDSLVPIMTAQNLA